MSNKQRRQQVREQERGRRAKQRRVLYAGLGIAAILVGVGIALYLLGSRSAVSGAAANAPYSDIQTVEDEGRGHLNPGEPHTYQHNPPTSGVHDPDPMPFGIYDNPIPVTREVHSLEHGYVIIHYNGISADQVQQLVAIVQQDSRKIILSPYPNMPYKISLTAWDHIQTLEGVNAQVIRNFIREFRDQGPEQTPM